jgi:hypothetical protein
MSLRPDKKMRTESDSIMRAGIINYPALKEREEQTADTPSKR